MKGLITKNQNGYFSLLSEDGNHYTCRSRGRLKTKTSVLVGDTAEYEVINKEEAVLTAVYPRKTELLRPPAANVDQLVLTAAIRTPDLDLHLLDKMIVLTIQAGIQPLLCINKADLAPEQAKAAVTLYRHAGYPCVCTSTIHHTGIDELRRTLTGHIIAFSGPSGAGKSSLINLMLGEAHFTTQEISTRNKRGKNTTRHAELVNLTNHSFLMDTPGYTSLSLESISEDTLDEAFPEFHPFLGHCRFANCRHITEPDCAVRTAWRKGNISDSRYHSYVQIYQEVCELHARR